MAYLISACNHAQDKRVPVIAEAGKKRGTEWLGIIETKLGDGRTYIAGNEFTAAGGSCTPFREMIAHTRRYMCFQVSHILPASLLDRNVSG